MNIAVVGVGYIGTIISLVLASKNHKIISIDNSKEQISNFNQGILNIYEPGLDSLFKKHHKNITFTTDYSLIESCEMVIVTVGTPLSDKNEADIKGIMVVAKEISKYLQPSALVCLKSTVIPGVSNKFADEVYRFSKKILGRDYFLTFSPERLAEGNAINEFLTLPIVVGSDDKKSLSKASKFWKTLVGVEIITIDTFIGAELTKLADNVWIDLNIALANSLGLICHKLGVDVNQVINAANSLPKGSSRVNILQSSIGVGGSCLTKDPLFFANLLDENELNSDLIRSARKLNELMPEKYIEKIESWIKKNSIQDPKIALIGVAFKSNTSDLRFSPMLDIFNQFSRKYRVSVHDPLVSSLEFSKKVSQKVNFVEIETALSGSDIIILGCAHESISLSSIKGFLEVNSKKNILFVDGRHAYKKHDFPKNINYLAI